MQFNDSVKLKNRKYTIAWEDSEINLKSKWKVTYIFNLGSKYYNIICLL